MKNFAIATAAILSIGFILAADVRAADDDDVTFVRVEEIIMPQVMLRDKDFKPVERVPATELQWAEEARSRRGFVQVFRGQEPYWIRISNVRMEMLNYCSVKVCTRRMTSVDPSARKPAGMGFGNSCRKLNPDRCPGDSR